MPKAPTDVAARAKALLDKKASLDLPDASKLKSAAAKRGESNADAFFSALVEGAFLLAAADGELSDDETATLGETVAHVTGDPLEPEEFMAMIDAFADALGASDYPTRVAAVAREVPDAAARREVLSFATLVALCDKDFAEAEEKALAMMAKAFDIPQADADAMVKTIADSLS